jgi:hypothetical protein
MREQMEQGKRIAVTVNSGAYPNTSPDAATDTVTLRTRSEHLASAAAHLLATAGTDKKAIAHAKRTATRRGSLRHWLAWHRPIRRLPAPIVPMR